jgi:hypothetical protein
VLSWVGVTSVERYGLGSDVPTVVQDTNNIEIVKRKNRLFLISYISLNKRIHELNIPPTAYPLSQKNASGYNSGLSVTWVPMWVFQNQDGH